MKSVMKIRIGVAAGVLCVAGLAMVGLGEPAPAGAPAAPSASNAGIAAKIADVSFLAGRWQGKMGKNKDNHVEEVWSNPSGNNVVGMFRWLKADGTPSMFELLTIQEEEGTLALRLRHQTATGATWEEKDRTVTMRLAEKGDNLLHFKAYQDCGDIASCRYEAKGGKLFIEVAFVEPDAEDAAKDKKARPALKFELERSAL